MAYRVISAIVILFFASNVWAQTVESLTQERNYYAGQFDKTRLSLIAYILQHKAATAALIASGGGVASFIEKNMDDGTRVILLIAGMLGAAYCLDNKENAKE